MNSNQPLAVATTKAPHQTEPFTDEATRTEAMRAGESTEDSNAHAKTAAVQVPASCGCGSAVKTMRRTAQSMFS